MPIRTHITAVTFAVALSVAAPASAGLIPPPGAPPAPATTANPIAGTATAINGTNGGVGVRWHIGFGKRYRTTVTQTSGRTSVLRGTLTNDFNDNPVAGAALTVITQAAGSNDWAPVAAITTSRTGRFRVSLPSAGHRRVAVTYWPTSASTFPIVSRRVLVRVRSRVWLGQPHRSGRATRFRGMVSGAPIPPGGVLVALQVHNNQGDWLTIRLTKTLVTGRFVIRYRMPRGAFKVRVMVPAQPLFGLYAGRSQTWEV